LRFWPAAAALVSKEIMITAHAFRITSPPLIR
jgi:hypothetical protein